MSQFIGRAEKEVKQILQEIYPDVLIISQFPIRKLIPYSTYSKLDEEIRKHKFDILVCGPEKLVIEVNYKHGEKAAIKWKNIFTPLIREVGAIPVTIDDYNCRTLFNHTKESTKKLRESDYQDVLDALKLAGVGVNFTIPKCN